MKTLCLIAWALLVCFQVVGQTDTNFTDSNGMKQGFWEEKAAPLVIRGYYQNDKKDGCWITYAPNGNPSLIENYKNGIKNGVTFTYDQQRTILVSERWFKNGVPNGPTRNFDRNGQVISYYPYKNGKLNGIRLTYYENTKSMAKPVLQEEASYVDDVRDGLTKWYNEKGTLIAEYNYSKGLFEGTQKTFYASGSKQSESFCSGNLKNGTYTEYFENGAVQASGIYKDDKKEGKWKDFDSNGNLVRITDYANDVAKSVKEVPVKKN